MPSKGRMEPMGGPAFGRAEPLFHADDVPLSRMQQTAREARMLALEDAARLCAKLGHPHAASEIRRQLIRGEGGDHG